MKTKYIDGNPEVCLQSGRSPRFPTLAQRCCQRAIVTPHLAARDRAMQLVKKDNPTLSPRIDRTWIDSWGRAEVMAIYRFH
ncbi:MAG: pyridoxamine 5'-phosphate oxidase family protein, partial [Microcoleus sp. T1-bin1]|nr:pyridoxamine 5'-phosphate oxidase family protein [Microcoleus sp. T1-bin1]